MRPFEKIFRVVFAIVFIAILCFWIGMAYIIFKVANDPSIVGTYAGEMINGYKETVK